MLLNHWFTVLLQFKMKSSDIQIICMAGEIKHNILDRKTDCLNFQSFSEGTCGGNQSSSITQPPLFLTCLFPVADEWMHMTRRNWVWAIFLKAEDCIKTAPVWSRKRPLWQTVFSNITRNLWLRAAFCPAAHSNHHHPPTYLPNQHDSDHLELCHEQLDRRWLMQL